MRQMNIIKSNKHNIYSVACNKIALSSKNDKRIILHDYVDTLALNHKRENPLVSLFLQDEN